MTSDFEGFSIPKFIHYIYFPFLISLISHWKLIQILSSKHLDTEPKKQLGHVR